MHQLCNLCARNKMEPMCREAHSYELKLPYRINVGVHEGCKTLQNALFYYSHLTKNALTARGMGGAAKTCI